MNARIYVKTALAVAATTFVTQAPAVTFDISGATSKNENYCTIPLLVFLGQDCSYTRFAKLADPDNVNWVGPIGGDGFYSSDPGTYFTTPGDPATRIQVPITGSVTVTGSGPSAQVSMTFTFGAAYRNYANGASTSGTDGWSSVTHNFSDRTVTSGVANGSGGFDYTIGVLPTLFTMRFTNEPFPSNVGSPPGVVSAPPVWNLPVVGEPGISFLEGNTSGVATTASVLGYSCAGTCGTILAWNTGAKAAYSNVLMRFSTDSSGNLVGGFAYLVKDIDTLSDFYYPGLDSWVATTMTFSGMAEAAPVAAIDDGPIAATEGVAKVIAVGANDTGFTDPVSVSVTTQPTKGTITAVSSPGPAANMTITYTANIGATGADSFVYDMTDGTPASDSATVTINISVDTDHDGVADTSDNCTMVSNASQLDSDGDGYGNICDADLNNSGLTTSTDFNLLRSVLNQPNGASALAAAADMNGSGLVTSTDFNLLRARLNTVPGPSGLH